ncbi:MAG: hypothetical protein QGI09_12460, partial [Dehalococcoidia bacterium]|nr:hypothetical protein [Dehalococcoidia bacterium]
VTIYMSIVGDPGDVVTATLRLRDVSGISEYFNAAFPEQPMAPSNRGAADLSVSLTEDRAETVAIVQATWPAWEFGCDEFFLQLMVTDLVFNASFFSYPIDVSCAIPETTPPAGWGGQGGQPPE